MSYLDLLRRPGARSFVSAGLIGRLPLSMVTLGVVLLVTAHGGSYALAGGMSAGYALAAAFIGPLGARWVDRSGQRRVLPILAAGQVLGLLAFTWAVVLQAPAWAAFVLLLLSGAVSPNIGSMIRARWAALLENGADLRSAFALEAVVDEIVFVIGPPLVTLIALQIDESVALVCCSLLIGVGAGWLAMQRATQPTPSARSGDTGHEPFLSGAFLVVALVLLLLGIIFGAFEVTTVAFTKALGAEQLTGIVLALYAVGSMISGLVLGVRTMQVSMARQLLVFAVVLAVVTIPLPFVGTVHLLMVAAFLAGLSVSPLLILSVTIVEHLVPPHRLTEALTLSTSGIAVGLAIGSTVSGVVIDANRANSGYLLMTGAGFAALVVAVAGQPVLRRAGLGDTSVGGPAPPA